MNLKTKLLLHILLQITSGQDQENRATNSLVIHHSLYQPLYHITHPEGGAEDAFDGMHGLYG